MWKRARMQVVAVAIAALGGIVAGPARGAVAIGIGQQTTQLFSSPYWWALDSRDVRYVAPWDALSDRTQRARLDAFLAAARHVRARVLIAFQHSLRNRRRARVLPTARQFARAFRGFRRRYPWVRDWVPWNETNHPASLTARRPALVAAYYNAATRICRRCDIVAGDVIDTSNMVSWVVRFLRHVRTPPRIWGLHNYDDANEFRSRGVRRLLSLVSGEIWFTETGGVVRYSVHVGRYRKTKDFGLGHAARATRHVLDLARISPRIRRIYLYNWQAPARFTTWDSGLMDARLRPRRAYRVLRAWLVRARRSRLVR